MKEDLLIKAIDLGFKSPKTTELEKYLLLCEVQKWLREVHNTHFIIQPNYKKGKFSFDYQTYFIVDGKEVYGPDSFSYSKSGHSLRFRKYNTYEEALEKGLFSALNLIKI